MSGSICSSKLGDRDLDCIDCIIVYRVAQARSDNDLTRRAELQVGSQM